MSSIRHHLTLAQASLIATRAHLESAFEHTIDQGYNSRWTQAIDFAITEVDATAAAVFNTKTCIEPPAAPDRIPPELRQPPTRD